eukprot:TRINITY_DN7550_c0_g1_i1.p1 TRINITY_DN7550_c0_g1~~TRINITY_DN7550_c0_g1_i1.p1  ORF type:complete len:251 (-),score=49.36 TRINITY_DN7550_c0_g1_i1:200-952(-)
MNLSDKSELIIENLETKEKNTMKQYEKFQFSGNDKVQSHGITNDFNLIYSPELEADLKYVKFNENSNFQFEKSKNYINGIYLLKGDADITIDNKLSILKEGSLCIINLQNMRAKECKITQNKASVNNCECLYFELFKKQLQVDYLSYNLELEKDRLPVIQELLSTEDDLHAMNLFKILNKTSRSYYFYQIKRHYCHNVASKIQMLLTGKYEDEVIFQQWVDKSFYPKGSILRGIRKEYKDEKEQLDVILN